MANKRTIVDDGPCPGCDFYQCQCPDRSRRHDSVLEEAARIVAGPRQAAYGHPRDNHGATAESWRTYIKRRYGIDVPLDAYDVCWMHVYEKGIRDAHERKRDNLVDGAGYLANAEMTGD